MPASVISTGRDVCLLCRPFVNLSFRPTPPTVSTPRPRRTPSRRPANAAQRAVVEHGFIPVRAKLIEVAAFLDRVERHAVADDFRCEALRAAAALLIDGKPERARRILESLSDPSTEPDQASSGKAALGAWQRPAAAVPASAPVSGRGRK